MIAAYLERADAQFWAWAESAMRSAPTPEAKLVAFDAVAKLASLARNVLAVCSRVRRWRFPSSNTRGHQSGRTAQIGGSRPAG